MTQTMDFSADWGNASTGGDSGLLYGGYDMGVMGQRAQSMTNFQKPCSVYHMTFTIVGILLIACGIMGAIIAAGNSDAGDNFVFGFCRFVRDGAPMALSVALILVSTNLITKGEFGNHKTFGVSAFFFALLFMACWIVYSIQEGHLYVIVKKEEEEDPASSSSPGTPSSSSSSSSTAA